MPSAFPTAARSAHASRRTFRSFHAIIWPSTLRYGGSQETSFHESRAFLDSAAYAALRPILTWCVMPARIAADLFQLYLRHRHTHGALVWAVSWASVGWGSGQQHRRGVGVCMGILARHWCTCGICKMGSMEDGIPYNLLQQLIQRGLHDLWCFLRCLVWPVLLGLHPSPPITPLRHLRGHTSNASAAEVTNWQPPQ